MRKKKQEPLIGAGVLDKFIIVILRQCLGLGVDAVSNDLASLVREHNLCS